MNARKIGMTVAALLASGAFGLASAKLPAPPPPTDEQKAKAAEVKLKADEAAKREADLLGKYQDRAVANFKSTSSSKPAGTAPAAKK